MGLGQPRPALGNLIRLEPIGVVRLLALPRDLGLEGDRIGFGVGHLQDALLSQVDVDAGGVLKRCDRLTVERPACQAEGQEGIIWVGFDLGRQHPGCGPPRLARSVVPLDDRDRSPGTAQRPGARRPDHPTADHHDISRYGHTMRPET